MNEEIMSKKF